MYLPVLHWKVFYFILIDGIEPTIIIFIRIYIIKHYTLTPKTKYLNEGT